MENQRWLMPRSGACVRPGGLFICIDSLDHNQIYRLNRWLHDLRGDRTKNTLHRMPDLARIGALINGFTSVNVHYFGALSLATPAVVWLYGTKKTQAVSDYFDKIIGVMP